MIKFDEIDRKILRALQRDCSKSVREIAEDVGLSQGPVWRRINQFNEEPRCATVLLDTDNRARLGPDGVVSR